MNQPNIDQIREERDAAWAELKRTWHYLEQIEEGLRELRRALPPGDPTRKSLLTYETMAGMGLTKKRQVGEEMGKRLEAMLEGE